MLGWIRFRGWWVNRRSLTDLHVREVAPRVKLAHHRASSTKVVGFALPHFLAERADAIFVAREAVNTPVLEGLLVVQRAAGELSVHHRLGADSLLGEQSERRVRRDGSIAGVG